MEMLCVLATLALAAAGPIVELEDGRLEGTVERSLLELPVFMAFLGIPYAEPPIGSLRFKPPRPPLPWNGTRQATKEGSVCVQLSTSTKTSTSSCIDLLWLTIQPQVRSIIKDKCSFSGNVGDEDCLFINVFTKQLPKQPGVDLKPVMVWIHGGGFITGSGNSDILGPNYLLGDDVVVCTLNYRLGAFGFMAMKDTEITGNMGLKDQAMALKWVQKNIDKFGGDPKKVTIFGQSSGAVCVHAHVLSSLSKGLFRRAISESGSLMDPFGFGQGVYNYSRTLAELLSCNTSLNLLECLQNCSAADITNSSLQAVLPLIDNYNYELPFTPTVEPPEALDACLTTDPLNYYECGNVNDVPYLMGVNNREAYISLPYIKNQPHYFERWRVRPDTFIPTNLDPSKYNTTELMMKIKRFYFGNKEMSRKTIKQYLSMVTDIQWFNGARETLKWQALVNKEPTYSYEFRFSGLWNYGKVLAGAWDWKGASHGDEIPYLWDTGVQDLYPLPWFSPTRVTSRRMVKMWTNFAKTGNPTSDLSDGFLTRRLIPWPPYTTANHSSLIIGTKLRVKPHLDQRSAMFWEDIYKKYGYNRPAQCP